MSKETWTIKRCLDWTRGYLERHGDERPRLSAEWLLSSVTGLSRTELYMRFDQPLTGEELARMHDYVARRGQGEPLQYIVGETAFRTIDVACEPGVLIPRPETEVLVEEVLTFLDDEVLGRSAAGPAARERVELPWNAEVEAKRQEELAAAAEAADAAAAAAESAEVTEMADAAEAGDMTDMAEVADAAGGADELTGAGATSSPEAPGEQQLGAEAPEAEPEVPQGEVEGGDAVPAASRVARVLEVGCGTGCISLSLATERPGRVVCVATDIEPKAVALAERNREALGIGAEVADFRLGNLVSPLDRATEWGTFDALVSNPPYIPTGELAALPREVAAFEPRLALDGGADGLDIFRRLLRAAPYMLREGGLLACELHEERLDAAAELCRAAGMRDVRVVADLAGRPRVILARTVMAATW